MCVLLTQYTARLLIATVADRLEAATMPLVHAGVWCIRMCFEAGCSHLLRDTFRVPDRIMTFDLNALQYQNVSAATNISACIPWQAPARCLPGSACAAMPCPQACLALPACLSCLAAAL